MQCGRWTVTESHDLKGFSVVPTDVIHWEPCENGKVPSGAVLGGTSEKNEQLYIGRARLRENRNELTPGMVVPSERSLLLSYGTGVRKTSNYEVLVSSAPEALTWLRCRGGHVPLNSVIGGIDCSYLEPLYVGRTVGSLEEGKTWRGQRLKLTNKVLESVSSDENNVHLPGKIHRTHRCLYIPYSDKEFLFRNYEVLVMNQSPASLLITCRASLRKILIEKWENCSRHSDIHVVDAVNESISLLPIPENLKEFCIETYAGL